MHTRISDDLDEALQDAARRLRVPVSNLVRNVLEDVFDVVEEAQEIGRRWEGRFGRRAVRRAREAYGPRAERREPPAPEPPEAAPAAERERAQCEFPDVAAWQPLIVNSVQDCAGCGRRILRGDAAYLAVGGSRPGPAFLCQPCLDGMDG